jgi:hypothetical protein
MTREEIITKCREDPLLNPIDEFNDYNPAADDPNIMQVEGIKAENGKFGALKTTSGSMDVAFEKDNFDLGDEDQQMDDESENVSPVKQEPDLPQYSEVSKKKGAVAKPQPAAPKQPMSFFPTGNEEAEPVVAKAPNKYLANFKQTL